MKYIFFFATPADIKPVLRRFEANAPLKFIETGMRAEPNRPIYLTSPELPRPGIATHETGFLSQEYLVSHQNTINQMHAFRDNSGIPRWLLNNGDNDETTLLVPAGLWRTGTLLAGHMCTLHKKPVAQQLMRWFLAALEQEQFTKIDKWWLGHEALAMLKSGKRLTDAEQAPPECDLDWPGALPP